MKFSLALERKCRQCQKRLEDVLLPGPQYVQCGENNQWISYEQLNDGPIFRGHLVVVNGKMACRYRSTIHEKHIAMLVKFSLALERKGSEP
ncbi:unnamed protein product [Camellia sinensis]